MARVRVGRALSVGESREKWGRLARIAPGERVCSHPPGHGSRHWVAVAQPRACPLVRRTAKRPAQRRWAYRSSAPRAGPGTAAAGQPGLRPLSHRGGRGSSRSPWDLRCRRGCAAPRRTPRLVTMSMLNTRFRRCAQVIAAPRSVGVLWCVSAAAWPLAPLPARPWSPAPGARCSGQTRRGSE